MSKQREWEWVDNFEYPEAARSRIARLVAAVDVEDGSQAYAKIINRFPDTYLWVIAGLPGCGKSTLVREAKEITKIRYPAANIHFVDASFGLVRKEFLKRLGQTTTEGWDKEMWDAVSDHTRDVALASAYMCEWHPGLMPELIGEYGQPGEWSEELVSHIRKMMTGPDTTPAVANKSEHWITHSEIVGFSRDNRCVSTFEDFLSILNEREEMKPQSYRTDLEDNQGDENTGMQVTIVQPDSGVMGVALLWRHLYEEVGGNAGMFFEAYHKLWTERLLKGAKIPELIVEEEDREWFMDRLGRSAPVKSVTKLFNDVARMAEEDVASGDRERGEILYEYAWNPRMMEFYRHLPDEDQRKCRLVAGYMRRRARNDRRCKSGNLAIVANKFDASIPIRVGRED